MNDDVCPAVEVSRRMSATPEVIFRTLSDPATHLSMDGSQMLRGAATEELVTGIGDVFVMDMHFDALGDYQMENNVVEFEHNHCITWEPVAGAGHPNVGTRMGHRWSFRLSPDGPDATMSPRFMTAPEHHVTSVSRRATERCGSRAWRTPSSGSTKLLRGPDPRTERTDCRSVAASLRV
jgi:hypothetical protein